MKIYTITCSNAYNYGLYYKHMHYAIFNWKWQVVEIIDYYPPLFEKISEKYRKNYFLRLIRVFIFS